MNYYAIIVAGGSGLRMGSEIPKQFLEVAGKPILMHTIQRFIEFNSNLKIVLVLPDSQHDFWKELCQKHQFQLAHTICSGGETRFHSVKNGLASINDTEALVAVHDGVRPLVSFATIEACFAKAELYSAAIPVTPVVESIRKVSGNESEALLRSEYYLVQTPQVFGLKILKEAYLQPYDDKFTDDASVIENLGYMVSLVNGNVENIKITRPIDLKLAELLLE